MSFKERWSWRGAGVIVLRLLKVYLVTGFAAWMFLKVRAALGWHGPLQMMLMNFVLMPLFLAYSAKSLGKRPVKGMVLFLLIADFVVFGMALATLLGAHLWHSHHEFFGAKTTLVIDHCEPSGVRAMCSGRVIGGGMDSDGAVTMPLSRMYAQGEVVHGVAYDRGWSGAGFAENGQLPARPPLLRSALTAAALLLVSGWIGWSLWRSIRAPKGTPVWEPERSILRKKFVETLFQTVGLAAVLMVTLLCAYLLLDQLGSHGEGDVRRALGLSAGDWMTVDGLFVGLVAWGYRKVKSPFGRGVIVTASRVSVFGVVLCFVVLLLEQVSGVMRSFIVIGDDNTWETLRELEELRRAFDPPLLLATGALLTTVYLMTMQFFEADLDTETSPMPTTPAPKKPTAPPTGQPPQTPIPAQAQKRSKGAKRRRSKRKT